MSMFYQICSQLGREALFGSLLYIHRDLVTHEPLVCLETAFTHRHSLTGQTHRHTITQHSLKSDLIKPEGRCNYMQPSSALLSIVMATCCLWVESLCAHAAVAQGLFNTLAV